MPDKRRFVQELVRVLAPGGTLVLATWNTRDPAERPFSAAESAELQYLYDEWCHPHFLSIPAFETLLREAGLSSVAAADWSTATIPSWRDSVAAGLRDPRGLLRAKPQQVGRLLRDAYTVLRMDAAFRKGLCRYGVLRGVKPA